MTTKKKKLETPSPEKPVPQGIFCKHCNRDHEKTFDNKGINHDKFNLGGKAETMFIYLCNQPKAITFVPLQNGDIPNDFSAIIQFTMNGLRINIRKNVQVEVPQDIADLIRESLEATGKAYQVQTENLNRRGTYKDARTDLLNEFGRNALDV